MLKLVLFALAAYALYRFFKNDSLRKKKREEMEEAEKTAEAVSSGDMVQDPECGAYVAVDDSISVRDGNRVYHFCSYECRDKFLKRLKSGDPGGNA